MTLNTERVQGINNALNSGLVLKAKLIPFRNHRSVTLVDLRDGEEFGFGQTADIERSYQLASSRFLGKGGIIYLMSALAYHGQSYSDRFITAGGEVRAYQKNGETHLFLETKHGNALRHLVTGPDFAESANFMEAFLKKERDLFKGVWDSVPQLERRFYQNITDLLVLEESCA